MQGPRRRHDADVSPPCRLPAKACRTSSIAYGIWRSSSSSTCTSPLPGLKPEPFEAKSHNLLQSLNDIRLVGRNRDDISGVVIKSNAEFFNIGSAVDSVWQRITIFERRGQFEAAIRWQR